MIKFDKTYAFCYTTHKDYFIGELDMYKKTIRTLSSIMGLMTIIVLIGCIVFLLAVGDQPDDWIGYIIFAVVLGVYIIAVVVISLVLMKLRKKQTAIDKDLTDKMDAELAKTNRFVAYWVPTPERTVICVRLDNDKVCVQQAVMDADTNKPKMKNPDILTTNRGGLISPDEFETNDVYYEYKDIEARLDFSLKNFKTPVNKVVNITVKLGEGKDFLISLPYTTALIETLQARGVTVANLDKEAEFTFTEPPQPIKKFYYQSMHWALRIVLVVIAIAVGVGLGLLTSVTVGTIVGVVLALLVMREWIAPYRARLFFYDKWIQDAYVIMPRDSVKRVVILTTLNGKKLVVIEYADYQMTMGCDAKLVQFLPEYFANVPIVEQTLADYDKDSDELSLNAQAELGEAKVEDQKAQKRKKNTEQDATSEGAEEPTESKSVEESTTDSKSETTPVAQVASESRVDEALKEVDNEETNLTGDKKSNDAGTGESTKQTKVKKTTTSKTTKGTKSKKE